MRVFFSRNVRHNTSSHSPLLHPMPSCTPCPVYSPALVSKIYPRITVLSHAHFLPPPFLLPPFSSSSFSIKILPFLPLPFLILFVAAYLTSPTHTHHPTHRFFSNSFDTECFDVLLIYATQHFSSPLSNTGLCVFVCLFVNNQSLCPILNTNWIVY